MKKIKFIMMLMLFLVLAVACSKTTTSGTTDDKTAEETATATTTEKTSADENPIVSVYQTTVTKDTIESAITVDGVVDAQTLTGINSEASGKLKDFNLKVGDIVKKDQIVAEVDPSKPGMNYMPSPVKSPITGTVIQVMMEEGVQVSPAVTLAYIRDLSDIEIKAKVMEKYISRLSVGEKVDLDFEAYPGKTFKGVVSRLDPVVDSQTRSLGVTVKLTSPSDGILAGMYTKLRIITEERKDVLVIPTTALFSEDGTDFVYRIGADDIISKVPVTVGLSTYEKVQVSGDIKIGDELVNSNSSLLGDGIKVLVVENGGAE
ncbi:MAG: efflux RND transporter periplasmic adaptor subunit [Spirochaetia bacterium]|jgi:multidrug efflux pump subunit AcrA (membrane-fusion protein)|nr:efflux RND transporter periplasmic adaptor subunit [Spirochaetia bacterium]